MWAVAEGEAETFGEMVRRLRHRRNVSQKKLSELTGGLVKSSHIARIETGELGATEPKVEALAEALEARSEERQKLLEKAGHQRDGRPSLADRVDQVERGIAELREELRAAIRRRPDTPPDGRPTKR